MGKAMKFAGVLILIIGLCTGGAFAQETSRPANLSGALPSVLGSQTLGNDSGVELTSGTYAVFHTTEGDFIAQLEAEWAPAAVANFVALATGAKRWRHPVSLEETTRPLYSNTQIYRIIPNAMIYGGDPINKGEADSGMPLPLETVAGVAFDQPGLLAMDSSGDKMSGSRWFITLRPFPERSGNFSVFGKVIGGLDIVQRITMKPVKRPQLPLDPVLIHWIEVVRIPPGRMTSGSYVMDEGLKVLRIDPNFKDAPMTESAEAASDPDSISILEPETNAAKAEQDKADSEASKNSDSGSTIKKSGSNAGNGKGQSR